MEVNEWVVTQPDDFHLHLRDFPAAAAYLKRSAAVFKRALIMPNTLPPIDSADALVRYRRQIVDTAPDFEPLMSFKISETTDPGDLAALKQAGAVAGKLYPKGATTHSEDGVSRIEALFPLLEEMQRLELVLCLHGEDPFAPVFERERSFLPTVVQLNRRFPHLKMVVEHLSTRGGVETVQSLPQTVAATLTLHHLACTRENLLANGMNPFLYCKPILQSEEDRRALMAAALSGSPRFFFGSDSAPHPKACKTNGKAAAGVYSAPVLLPALAALFESAGALESAEGRRRAEAFFSKRGAEFYGLPINRGKVALIRKKWQVAEEYDGAVPLYAGETLPWALQTEVLC